MVDLLIKSREHESGDLCSVPTSMLGCALKRCKFSETSLEDKPFLLALPKEVLVLFGERTQVHILLRILVNNILRVDLDSLSISEQSWPKSRPAWMENFLLWHVGTECKKRDTRRRSPRTAAFPSCKAWCPRWVALRPARFRNTGTTLILSTRKSTKQLS